MRIACAMKMPPVQFAPADGNIVQRVGIARHRRALGQHIQAGEQAETGIEPMLAHMGVALGEAQQLQRQEGQQVAQRRDLLIAAPAAGGLDHLRETGGLPEKRRKQKHTGRRRIEPLSLPLLRCSSGERSVGYLRPLHGPADLQSRAPRQLLETFLRQHALHGAHRDIDTVFQQH